MADNGKVRLSLELSNDLNALLEELTEKTHTSKADVLRKAIALMEVAVEAKQEGNRLGVLDKQNQVVTRIVGL